MKHFFDDSIANAAGKIACAMLPLITLGAIYNDTIEIVACIVGLIAAIVLAARITMMFGKTEPKVIANLDKTVSDLLALPYALFLCSTILLISGISAAVPAITAVALSIIIIATKILIKE